jgi:hypothetical protein
MTAVAKRPALGRGALRTHRFLLAEGGWWNLREMVEAMNLSDTAGVHKQLQALYHHKCIARKGTGVAGDPYRFGVTAACVIPFGGMCS